jgi:glutathione S-transferase
VLEWLMWQMGGPGPMFGQVHHFVKYNKGKPPYAEERYLKDAHRLYSVLDRRLAQHEFVAGDYSIADIAVWPWVSRYEWHTVDSQRLSEREALVHVLPSTPPCSEATKCLRTSAKFLCLEWSAAHSIDQRAWFMNGLTVDKAWELAKPKRPDRNARI